MSIKRAFALLALVCAFAPCALPAQTAKASTAGNASVTLSWSPVEGVGGYTLELSTLSGALVSSTTVEGTQATISAPPGDYLIRIVSLNHFMRPESASPWKKISIVRKGKPKFESLAPAFVEPGKKAIIVLKGKNVDASTVATLRKTGSKTAIKAVTVRVIDSSILELSFPPIKEVGLYSLELLNKPDYSLVIPEAFAIKHREAVVDNVVPAELNILEPNPRFSISGKDIEADASLRLERDGKIIKLSPVARSAVGLEVQLPQGIEEGSYDLVIENDALSITRTPSAIRLISPIALSVAVAPSIAAEPATASTTEPAATVPTNAPTVTVPTNVPAAAPAIAPAVLPEAIPSAIEPAAPSAQTAQAPSEPSAVSSARPAASQASAEVPTTQNRVGGSVPPETVAAPAAVTSPVAAEAPAIADAAAQAAPTPEAPAMAAPTSAGEPATTEAVPTNASEPAPAPASAEEPILLPSPGKTPLDLSDSFSLSAGWNTAFALGEWASILAPSFLNADISLRFGMPDWKILPSLRFGAELRAEASFFGTISGDATYVSSSFTNYNLALGPWLVYSWPRFDVGLRLGGGIAYSSIEVSGSNLDASAVISGYSVDPSVCGGLEFDWKPTAKLAVGLQGGLRLVFFTDRNLITIPAGVFIRYEL
jgi:hypothetical protein